MNHEKEGHSVTGSLKMGVSVNAHTRHIFLGSGPPPPRWALQWSKMLFQLNYFGDRCFVQPISTGNNKIFSLVSNRGGGRRDLPKFFQSNFP